MSTIRNPVGPLPPEVYWRRRLVVGVGILAVIVIIVLIIVGPGSGDPADQPTPEPTTSETAPAGGEPGAAPGEVAPCTAAQVEVTPITDANAYAANEQPLLSLSIVNTSTVACSVQAGSDVQSYVITSGSDRIWASTDCQDPGVPAEVTLEPGEPLTSTPFPWSRTRSTPDDCDSERPPVIAGGATYRLSVSVGEFASESDLPFILN